MSKTIPNLAHVQAFLAAQAGEIAELLGLSLSHATTQKRLKDEKACVEAALRLQLHGHNKHRFAQSPRAARNWH